MEMLKTVAKAWNIPDIRKKIIFTLLMLLVFPDRVSIFRFRELTGKFFRRHFNSETGLVCSVRSVFRRRIQ